MKTRHLMLSVAAIVMLQLLNSCYNEPLGITIEEQYTRSFINTFGLIAADQDWNTAQATAVTVDVGPSKVSSVKVYAKVGDKYFLTADLANISGKFNVPIEVPDGTSDIMVKVDGKEYFTAPGGTVSAAAASRGLASTLSATGTASSGIFSLQAVEIGYEMFNAQQISPIVLNKGQIWNDYYTLNVSAGSNPWRRNTLNIGGLMPEIQDAIDQNHREGNQLNYDPYHDKYINKDFWIEPGDGDYVTFQPVYWQTSGVHNLGIYPVDDDFNPISKTTGQPLVLNDIKTVLGDQTEMGYSNLITWDYLKSHSLADVKVQLGSNCYTLLGKIAAEVQRIQDDMIMIPFYTDKVAEDIQTGVPPKTLISISFNKPSIELCIGHSQDNSYTVYPWDFVGDKTVTSSNTDVATVTNDNTKATITAVGVGTATITVSCQYKTATCIVNVIKGRVNFTEDSKSLWPNDTYATSITKEGSFATDEVTYASSDESVATVNSSGVVTAVAAGTCTITATCDGVSGTMTIIVNQEAPYFYMKLGPDTAPDAFAPSYITGENSWDKTWTFLNDDDAFNDFLSDVGTWATQSNLGTFYSGLSSDNVKTPSAIDAIRDISSYSYTNIYKWNEGSPLEETPTCPTGQWDSNRNFALKMTKTASRAPQHYTAPKASAIKRAKKAVSMSSRDGSDSDPMPPALNSEGAVWTSIGNNSPTFTTYQLQNPTLARSKKFKLTVYKNGVVYTDKYCMYIEYSTNPEKYFFSQTLMNYYMGSGCPCPDGASPTFAASYMHPMSERTYFSFEDWSQVGSDMDINDLVFIIDNVQRIGGTSTIEIPTSDTPIDWIWAVEDLGSTDDFDFNDVVVKINSVTTNYISGGAGTEVDPSEYSGSTFYKKVTFTALAAGGTMKTHIKWSPSTSKTYYLKPGTFIDPALSSGTTIGGGTPSSITQLNAKSDAGEFHKWFGSGNYPYTTMINTTTNNVDGLSCVIYTSEDFTVDGFGSTDIKAGDVHDGIVGLSVEVEAPSGTVISDHQAIDGSYDVARPAVGWAPQMFIIHEGATKWKWPTERTSITKAYATPGYSFKEWVADKSIKWFESPSGSVINRKD